ncbi:hypothetical protein ACI8AF_14440 [Blastococcus sp. SYSU D00669]
MTSSTRDVEPATRGPAGPRRRFLVPLCLAVVAVRALHVPRPLRNDEGGYLLVARRWHTGGEFLYGDHFVDRPPLLLLIFRVAALVEWDQAVRVLAIPFVVGFVLAGWRAGHLLGGPSGGRWAAVVAAGVVCSPGLAADQADGELFGAALVMASLALALTAWHAESRSRPWWALAAGAVAAAAPLVKQNLLEGVLFLTGLVVAACWRVGGAARARAVRFGAAAALGAGLVVGAGWLWLAAAGIDPAAAWRDLVGFRGAAFDVIWSDEPDASIRRAGLLLVLGLVTGLLPIVLTWFAAGRTRRGLPAAGTVTALLVFGLAAIAAGGSFWPPYLLQLAPAGVLAAGLLAPSPSRPGAWMRGAGRAVVAAAVVGTVVTTAVPATDPAGPGRRIGEWLAASREAGDTGFVAYGLPSVLETADLSSPYPYLWSVPMRTLDPDQSRLRATLAGPDAPTWVVEVTGLNAWGIDDGGRLRALLDQEYRVVAEVCGSPVWLRRDLTRQLAPRPAC